MIESVQFSSGAQSCLTLCDPMNCSMLGLPVHHQLPEFTQTHVHRVSDGHPAISSSVVPFSSCPQSLPASESLSSLPYLIDIFLELSLCHSKIGILSQIDFCVVDFLFCGSLSGIPSSYPQDVDCFLLS